MSKVQVCQFCRKKFVKGASHRCPEKIWSEIPDKTKMEILNGVYGK